MRPIIPAAFASCVIFNDKEMLRLQGTSEINRDKVADGRRKGSNEIGEKERAERERNGREDILSLSLSLAS